jgi:HPt (histidine-containing phosphotransfer) domain-containing protein
MHMTINTTSDSSDVLDPRFLLDLEKSNTGLGMAVAKVYLTKLPQEVIAIRTKLLIPDLPSVNRLAHKLKGSSASVGAVTVRAKASELESVALTGNVEQCGQILTAIEQASNTFIQNITLTYLERLIQLSQTISTTE